MYCNKALTYGQLICHMYTEQASIIPLQAYYEMKKLPVDIKNLLTFFDTLFTSDQGGGSHV